MPPRAQHGKSYAGAVRWQVGVVAAAGKGLPGGCRGGGAGGGGEGGVRVGLEETKLGAGEGGGRGAILLQMDPVFVCIETN